ncbi:MAG: hypothetical protein KKE16_01170 [Firmicutes bacterium]|nr:hypothetical protein [Bacillota bacterium]
MIQIIRYTTQSNKDIFLEDKPDRLFSSFASPKSLDEFDVNILDLTNEKIWMSPSQDRTNLYVKKDLQSIKNMIVNSKKSKIVVILPSNIMWKSYLKIVTRNGRSSEEFGVSEPIKNILPSFISILSDFIPEIKFSLMYENTTSKINDVEYNAAFYFNLPNSSNFVPLLVSESSEKVVLIANKFSNIYICTIDILKSDSHFLNFIYQYIVEKEVQTPIPQWIDTISILDDVESSEKIIELKKKEAEILSEIDKQALAINGNNIIKSILYEKGDTLVKIVKTLISEMMNIDMSSFVDKKGEDFLAETEEVIFLGEVKGTKNYVKTSFLSQLDNHIELYRESQCDNSLSEKAVKGLLIVNYQNELEPKERSPIQDSQVSKAYRNDLLIIDTVDLLDLYCAFKTNKISSAKIISLLSSSKGLLNV